MENIRDIEERVRESCQVVLDQHRASPDLAQLICDEAAKIVAPYRDPVVTVTVDRENLTSHVEIIWDAYDYYMLSGFAQDALD